MIPYPIHNVTQHIGCVPFSKRQMLDVDYHGGLKSRGEIPKLAVTAHAARHLLALIFIYSKNIDFPLVSSVLEFKVESPIDDLPSHSKAYLYSVHL